MFRLGGFFPYTWWTDCAPCADGKTKFTRLHLKKSTAWRIWSFVWAIIVIVLMIIDSYFAITYPRGNDLGFNTMVIAHMIYDVITAAATILMHVTMWWQYEQAAYFIRFSEATQVNISITSTTTNLLILCVMLSVPLNIVLYIINFSETTPVLSIITYEIKILWSTSLMLIVGATYHNTMTFISTHLKNLFQPLEVLYEEYTSSLVPIQDEEHIEELRFRGRSRRVSTTADLGKTFSIDDEQPIQQNTDQAMGVLPRCKALDLLDIKKKVLILFKVNKLVNTYSEFPLAVAMSNLVVWALTTMFYITLWRSLQSWTLQVISISNIFSTFIPIVYILNSSNCLQTRVSHMSVKKYLFPIIRILATTNE